MVDLRVHDCARLGIERRGHDVISPVNWGWQGYGPFLDQCELQVDRADTKGFVLLAIDTKPGYTDTQPFPGAPAKWTYQAIYRVADSRVGQWSNPVSIAVGV